MEAKVPGKVLVAGLEPIWALGRKQDVNRVKIYSGLSSLIKVGRPESTSNFGPIGQGHTKHKFGEATLGKFAKDEAAITWEEISRFSADGTLKEGRVGPCRTSEVSGLLSEECFGPYSEEQYSTSPKAGVKQCKEKCSQREQFESTSCLPTNQGPIASRKTTVKGMVTAKALKSDNAAVPENLWGNCVAKGITTLCKASRQNFQFNLDHLEDRVDFE